MIEFINEGKSRHASPFNDTGVGSLSESDTCNDVNFGGSTNFPDESGQREGSRANGETTRQSRHSRPLTNRLQVPSKFRPAGEQPLLEIVLFERELLLQ